MIKQWYKSGDPFIWLNAAAVSASIIMVSGLLILIAYKGLIHFWPASVLDIQYQDQNGQIMRLIGELHDQEDVKASRLRDAGLKVEGDGLRTRYMLKVGNRDYFGQDFRWVLKDHIQQTSEPALLTVVERREWGNFYGYLKGFSHPEQKAENPQQAWVLLEQYLDRYDDLYAEIRHIEKKEIGDINYELEKLRLRKRGLELDKVTDPEPYAELEAEKKQLEQEYEKLYARLNELYARFKQGEVTFEIMDGRMVTVPLSKIVRAFRPNSMSTVEKIGHYFMKLWEFGSDEPREANTEGGIFPAIFGTVMMVIIMSILVTPFGVVAAVYLREYARQGPVTRLIRIAVNNLAGVPSIVYGVFGLGFFVYFIGGNLDRLFFPEALPAPTFGSPGLLWASLTLALLTLPVVIVSTEEGLSRIPRAIREGSLALGATKAETLWRTVLPMASPAMMTGLILAIARAAGEVAPLMLVGVVKLAPSLPLDGNAPFIHLERKFMHLGFHIYDVGFQSPNVEAARPLVYATSLLLVLVIIVLNLTAIHIRNHLREKYRSLEQ
jgi:phosphate transport system permease protein